MPFAVGTSGKPLLPAGLPFFSLSHCPGFALIAVDVSGQSASTWSAPVPSACRPTGRVSCWPRRQLAPSERELGATGQDLLHAWVRLEAFAKADGRGIGRLLTALGIVGGRTGDISASVRTVRESWPPFALRDLDVPVGHFAALAALYDPLSARIPVRQFSELIANLLAM